MLVAPPPPPGRAGAGGPHRAGRSRPRPRRLAAARADTGALPWTDAARQLQARAALLRGLDPSGWPDLSDAALRPDWQGWLAPHLHGHRGWRTRQARPRRHPARRLGWEQAARLDRDLPTHLALPGGRAAVDYTQPVPLAEARAQAFYGLADDAALAGGRVPLRLALLSPAGRPIAVTADLAGFWRGAWADARKDMRGRYPRHDWPEIRRPRAPAAVSYGGPADWHGEVVQGRGTTEAWRGRHECGGKAAIALPSAHRMAISGVTRVARGAGPT